MESREINCRTVSYFLGQSLRRGRTRGHLGSGASDARPDRRHRCGRDPVRLRSRIPDTGLPDRSWGHTPALGREGKNHRIFQGVFTVIGEEITSKIVFVCSDMWEPYLKVIRKNAPRLCTSSTGSTSWLR